MVQRVALTFRLGRRDEAEPDLLLLLFLDLHASLAPQLLALLLRQHDGDAHRARRIHCKAT